MAAGWAGQRHKDSGKSCNANTPTNLHIKAVGAAGAGASKACTVLGRRLLPAVGHGSGRACLGRVVALPAAARERGLPEVCHCTQLGKLSGSLRRE